MTLLLMCRSPEVPTPSQIVAALSSEGFNAVAQTVKQDLHGSYTVEIEYQPSRMPIVVTFGPDFVDEPNTSEYELWHFLEKIKRNRPIASPVNRTGDLSLFTDRKIVHVFREKLLSELVPDEEARTLIRRFTYVNALENADERAVQAVVTFVQAQTDSLLGSDSAPN